MRLLVCAHKGEAQEFIKSLKLKPFDVLGYRVYTSEKPNIWLLVTGEGCLQAMASFSAVAAVLKNQFGKLDVYQFGVAGALNEKLQVNEIYQIRTVYKQKHQDLMEANSFELSPHGLDLCTAQERVTDLGVKKSLSYFADLVDREAWGVCYSSQKLGLKPVIFKLISDEARDADVCDWVKTSAEFFSKKLFDYYTINFSSKENQVTAKDEPFELEGYYFTKTQKVRFDNYRSRYGLLADFDFNKDLQKFMSSIDRGYEDLSPKRKTSLLLDMFDDVLNPHMTAARKNFDKYLETVSREPILSYNRNLESPTLSLQTKISSHAERDKLVATLNKIDFSKINSIVSGEGLNV